MASNNGYSSASGLKSSLHGGSLPTELTSKRLSVVTSRFGLHRKPRSSVAVQLFPWEHACLKSRFSATTLVYLLVKNLLTSNGRCSVACFAAIAYKRTLFQRRSLATAVSLAPKLLLWANMPEYVYIHVHRRRLTTMNMCCLCVCMPISRHGSFLVLTAGCLCVFMPISRHSSFLVLTAEAGLCYKLLHLKDKGVT
jgi:hypothetical protein